MIRQATPLTIACVQSDQASLIQVTERIRRHGGQSSHLSRSQLLQATVEREIAAVVYDMEPGGAGSVDLVRAVHYARPEWPVWIYCAPRPLAVEAVAHVASFRGVWATPRVAGLAGEAEIDIHVRRLLFSIPRVQLLRLLQRVLEPLPLELRVFLEASLGGKSQVVPVRFKAANGTAHLRSRLRHLQRLCKATGLPGPKRLLDHLLFVLLTYMNLVFDVPLLRAAEQEGLSRKALDRLRQRVLGPDARAARLQPDAQFEFALMSLAEVCRTPRRSAAEIVQEVFLERRA